MWILACGGLSAYDPKRTCRELLSDHVVDAIAIVRPETIIRWHRAGFRAYWRWRLRNPVGRPKVSAELRTLIGEMSRANPL
jgi:hypothetical protein